MIFEPSDEEVRKMMNQTNDLIMKRGVSKAPARWTPEYFRNMIGPVITETITNTVLSLGIPREPGSQIPQWAFDLANDECVIALADVIEQDIKKYGAD